MITPEEVLRLHNKTFPRPILGEVLKCSYNLGPNCEIKFKSWLGCLGQNLRGKKNNCCKYCLDYMRSYMEKHPFDLMDNFHEGFRKKSDKKAWLELDYSKQKEFVSTLADYGIALYQPPER